MLLNLLALRSSLPAAPGAVPALPCPSAAAPCRLQAPVSTHALTTQTLQAAHQGITPFTTVAPVETPVLRTNMMRLCLAGISNDSPRSLPHVNPALPVFKECHKSQTFPLSLEKCPVLLVTLSLCWCVTKFHQCPATETPVVIYFALSWKEHFW